MFRLLWILISGKVFTKGGGGGVNIVDDPICRCPPICQWDRGFSLVFPRKASTQRGSIFLEDSGKFAGPRPLRTLLNMLFSVFSIHDLDEDKSGEEKDTKLMAVTKVIQEKTQAGQVLQENCALGM